MTNNITITDDVFKCPITLDYMKNPVMASDGQFYERESIEKWLINNNTSPYTRNHMDDKLVSSHVFNSLLEQFYDKNCHLKPLSAELLMNPKFKLFSKENIKKYMVILDDSDHDTAKTIFKNEDFINFLIDNYSDEYINYELNWTSLVHFVIKFGNYDMIKKVIIKEDIDLDTQDNEGWTSLHFMCGIQSGINEDEQLKLLKLMLIYDININAKTVDGKYPIHMLCSKDTNLKEKNQLEAIKLLINAGADVTTSIHNKELSRPIDFVINTNYTNMSDQYRLQAAQCLINAEASNKRIKLSRITKN